MLQSPRQKARPVFSATGEHSGAGVLKEAGELMVNTVNRAALNVIAECDQYPKIVKIDVEGYEPVVIEEFLQSSMRSQIGTSILKQTKIDTMLTQLRGRFRRRDFFRVSGMAGKLHMI